MEGGQQSSTLKVMDPLFEQMRGKAFPKSSFSWWCFPYHQGTGHINMNDHHIIIRKCHVTRNSFVIGKSCRVFMVGKDITNDLQIHKDLTHYNMSV